MNQVNRDHHQTIATNVQQLTAPYSQEAWLNPPNQASLPISRSGNSDGSIANRIVDKEASTIPPHKVSGPLAFVMLVLLSSFVQVNWEHHGQLVLLSSPIPPLTGVGPGSWVSICSQPGQRWISERIGNTDFNQSAKTLILSWSQRLKILSPRNKSEEPEPDEATAWRYCTGKLRVTRCSVWSDTNQLLIGHTDSVLREFL